ncbi:Serine/threonine-protein kinase PknD [Maioricimonas rarisocia]|uniref:Serine/threonine-protein kinase PknD n=1 Tax=Maioricimonas rarisocia TaxID=2528026 RepID=A0A517ZC10_9PLAN|nr:hypothetical protein [Maioricimonas rarisocia]QDU40033.1 Serine/threonine-protein kinase PknD [Maioricimonas rarisocia]
MLRFLLLSAAILASPAITGAAEVVTVAGTGAKESTGDGTPATQAGIAEPYGLVVGPDRALYVCEIAGHVIRRIDPETGHAATVVGNGTKGNDGDGGPATDAAIDEPYEIRFDQDGHMFFVDMKSAVVRRVDARTGIITTVAGNGTHGFSGDGGTATEAQMHRPHSIALDDRGNLYICDIGNHRVRRVDLKSGIITTFAGTGERKPTPDGAPIAGTPLNGPRALDFHPEFGMVLALREGNAVYRVDLEQNKFVHLAGTGRKGFSGHGGPAKQATLSGPKGIAFGPNGDVYLADTESHTIRVVRASDGRIETIVGDGKRGDGPDGNPLSCRLARPHGVYVDSQGQVYIGDSENHRVRKLTAGP